MSALLYSSPRSSPAPADAHLQQHMARQRHHVSFGQAQQQQQSTSTAGQQVSSSLFAQPAPFPSSSSASTSTSAFGFGFASASTPLPSTSYGFGQQAQSAAYKFPFAANAAAAAGASASSSNVVSPNRRRRRRSDSPSNDREMEDNDDDGDSTSAEALQSFHGAGGKRIRREIRPIKSMHSLAGSNSAAPTASASSTNEVDIGKALTSLSKPALLSVLTALLTQQPSLKPAVLALLPPPSLDTFTVSLHASEKKVLDALPLGGRGLRDEYVWSRVRAPLEEFIAEARLALSQFCPSSSTAFAPSPIGESEPQQQQHPATIFAFLYTLTLSIRKLEATLPRAPLPFGATTMRATASTSASSSSIAAPSINNPSSLNQNDPLVCFLPLLFNQWHVLVTKLTGLLQHGHVMSAEMVRTWFKQLDTLVDLPASSSSLPGTLQLGQEPASVGRKASEAVRERFVKEMGWLIGLRVQNTAGPATDSQMTQDTEDIDEEL